MLDDEIVALYWAREARAIEETDKKYGNYLYKIVNRILVNREDSLECVNDTYLKTWNAIPPTMPKIFRAFLAKTARNTAVDRYKEAKRQKRIPVELCEPLDDFEGFLTSKIGAEEELEAKEIGHVITRYLDSLSNRKMYIFFSRYYFAMPIAEIAGRVGVSESTINKEIATMKKELKKLLVDEGISL